MKLRKLGVIGVSGVVTVAGVAVATGLANAAEGSPDLTVGADTLLFQPPVEIPDIGKTQVRIANVGNATPSLVRMSLQTGGLINFVATDVPDVHCNVTSKVNGRNVAICTIPPGYLDSGELLTVNLTVEVGSPPSPIPFDPDKPPDLKIAVVTRGDPDGAQTVVKIGR